MSIVSPLKSGKSHLSLVEGPDFATWKTETLVQFAKQAHERLKAHEAQKELRAAQRIMGSPSVIPYLAQCELALGNPRKTLEIAGSVDPKILSAAERVELRLAAAGARTALGQHAALS